MKKAMTIKLINRNIKNEPVNKTIRKTLVTSVLQDGFWSRWFAHGIEPSVLIGNRAKLGTLDGWISILCDRALAHSDRADVYNREKHFIESELHYRISGLYYCMIQWIFPEPDNDKTAWYSLCESQFEKADRVSNDKVTKHKLSVDNNEYMGRIRIPNDPTGCVVIVNPIDSPKEELFTYEVDFAEAGLVVVSFDGPGQGSSFFQSGNKANTERWSTFLNKVIEFTNNQFPTLPIHLFGTSSGASWAIEGNKNPLVSKSVAVSPACQHETKMPDYFKEKMVNVLEEFDQGFLPRFENLNQCRNILVFHGGRDVMVEETDVYNLYTSLQHPKRLIEYKDEGHCCDFKLAEIRSRSIKWFKGDNIDGI
jgi:hypothetical protein